MHRNKLVDQFQGYSDYRNPREGKENNSSNLCEKLKKYYKNIPISSKTISDAKTVDRIK